MRCRRPKPRRRAVRLSACPNGAGTEYNSPMPTLDAFPAKDLSWIQFNCCRSHLRIRDLCFYLQKPQDPCYVNPDNEQLGSVPDPTQPLHPTFTALQDPPLNMNLQLPGYWLETKDDWPQIDGKDCPVVDDENRPVHVSRRVAFYVSKRIHRAEWEVTWEEGVNKHYVAYLRIGDIHFTNFYNRIQGRTIDFDQLFGNPLVCSPKSVIICDGNAHHAHWGGREVRRTQADARAIRNATADAGMCHLVRDGKTPTYKCGNITTTIDLAVVGADLEPLVRTCLVLRPRGFESDHALIHVVLNLPVEQDPRQSLRWDKVTKEQFCDALSPRLRSYLGNPDELAPDPTVDTVGRFLPRLCRAVKETMDDVVPKTDPNPLRQPPRPIQLERALAKETNLRHIVQRQSPGTAVRKIASQRWQEAILNTNKALQTIKRCAWRRFTVNAAKTTTGLHGLIRQARAASKPRPSAHIPFLQKTGGGKSTSDVESALVFRHALFDITGDKSCSTLSSAQINTVIDRYTRPLPAKSSVSVPSASSAPDSGPVTGSDSGNNSGLHYVSDSSNPLPLSSSGSDSGSPSFSDSPSLTPAPSLGSSSHGPRASNSSADEPTSGSALSNPSANGKDRSESKAKRKHRGQGFEGVSQTLPLPNGRRATSRCTAPDPPRPRSAQGSSDQPLTFDQLVDASAKRLRQKSSGGSRRPRRTRAQMAALKRLVAEAPPQVTSYTIRKIVRKMPRRKSPGPDGITTEALKMGLDVLLPYLVYVFTACIKLGHFPDCFKESLTVMIRKEGKPHDDLPKSYRPIALLSSVGKILERLVADHLKDLALRYKLVPPTQFGFAGRNCTKAVELIVNGVYNGWCGRTPSKKWKTSLLGLDISGAYDHVKHLELLLVLIDMGLPRWLIQFVWAFISARCTYLVLPGFTSPKFWVHIGIPQGSPMSPILFALFTAPMLEILEEEAKKAGAKFIILGLSYVDDTYIMVSSDDWEDNRNKLADLHEKLLDWATPRGLRFDPTKYNVMHFSRSNREEENCILVPPIPGLSSGSLVPKRERVKKGKGEASGGTEGSEVARQGGLRILGVIVDPELHWEHHIQHVSVLVSSLQFSSSRVILLT
ncbi:Zinc knuckle [Colletotrichum higginsianum IMI 349063]|uniref:Zinc knuckle n=1 Tax=Colletotrichum higginsianum (strain IMI 349063) TaxID=759273 RepID=A0A1B7XXD2_COLHI|nr:Zinc knuckle [Colletotrichum higginsianum IMI 349063]OBR04426.1 Zinc knuckle [Colletotrichum higginsianum IMI 349063]